MSTLMELPSELQEAQKYLDESARGLASGDEDQQKASLALIFLIRESLLEILESETENLLQPLYNECWADLEDLTYMVYDFSSRGSLDFAQYMRERYSRIVAAVIVYFRFGLDAFLEVDDTIEEYEDESCDPIGFVNLEASKLALQEIGIEIGGLKNALSGNKILNGTLSRRGMAIDIIAIREDFWKAFSDICNDRDDDISSGVDGGVFEILQAELQQDTDILPMILSELEVDGKSQRGILLLNKTLDMVGRLIRFCHSEEYSDLQGSFLSLDVVEEEGSF